MAYGAEPGPSLIFLEIYVSARSVSNSLTNSASCNYNSCVNGEFLSHIAIHRRVQSLEIAYSDFDLFSLKISIFGDPERRKSYKIKGIEVRYTMKEAEKHDSKKDLSYERKRWWQKSTILLL
ncbi:unnamed protein product [Arabidopsis lyrata]|uniref:Predicted protein n=1 Tax=Arabidopsis lyrata subsp. lyrata TaxID=81972 RepID=D7MUR5_ARALL|nr:predicted protein [Arabidopsis lyrata subsp. lyrata]CAH8278229.1 unnamed protein product [Arabidopsis lyrata]